jgi:hypothetical protein
MRFGGGVGAEIRQLFLYNKSSKMKIKTTIEFEIETDGPLRLTIPAAGIDGQGAISALRYFLNVLGERDIGVVITKSSAQSHETRQIPPDVSAAVARRLDLRLRESEEEIGEWFHVEDRLPTMTVLGLTSAVCSATRGGSPLVVDAVYHGGDSKWKSPEGHIVYDVREWRQKPGVKYDEPQERYEQVARENAKKREWGEMDPNEFPY